MSEAGPVPFTESKAPESADRLHRGALRLIDISASTMANIGPAYSFYFGFGLLVITAGIAAPLTILAAIVAIALLGNTLSQFSRAHPSTGGFITFVGKTFGGTSAVTTALLAGAGYIIAISSVLVISGGFLSMTLNYYFGWNVPWIIFSVLLTAGAMVMMFRGVAVSTKLAGFFFGFELLVLLVVAFATLIKNGGHLSVAPFEPKHITNGFSGLAAGFPLAVYLFIGWENSAALAEETNNPRRNVPRAVFMSIALMAVTYLLLAYSTVSGFHDNGTALAAAPIPFISVAHGVVAWMAFIAFWALGHWIGGHSNSLDALNYFFESGTMGTLLVLVVYFLANLALPFYYRKYRPSEFNVIKHLVLPVLGMAAIAVPVYYLCKPGQPDPYDWFPYAALGVIVVSVLYAIWLVRRDPGLGERVGSIVADE